MWRYVGKRLLLMIPILIGVSFLIFGIMNLTPGDPATVMLGDAATPEAIEQLNIEYGFDKPFLVRYVNYIKDIVTKFDFGRSFRTKVLVTDEIKARFPVSLKNAIMSMIFACVVGIPIGVLSAVKQHTLLDTIPTFMSLILASMPAFWFGMLMLLIFSLKLRVLPAGGIGTWKHYVLPVVTLGLSHAATIMRYTRSSMLETIREDYIRTARAKGVSERNVIWKHALKNALLPVVTIIGINFAGLLGGAVSTETLYSLPGTGRTLVESIKMKDLPVVLGLTLFLSFVSSFIVLFVDIIYAFIDPRIRAQYES